MPVAGFFVALIGGGLFGACVGLLWLSVYIWILGAPGATGLEVLVVPNMALLTAAHAACGAIVALSLPRLPWSWAKNFIVLVVASIVLWFVVQFFGELFLAPNYDAGLRNFVEVIRNIRLDKGSLILSTSFLFNLVVCSRWFRAKFADATVSNAEGVLTP